MPVFGEVRAGGDEILASLVSSVSQSVYILHKTVFQIRHRLRMGGGKQLDRGQHSTIHLWAGPEWQQYFKYLNSILMVNDLLPIMNSRTNP